MLSSLFFALNAQVRGALKGLVRNSSAALVEK